MYVKKSIIFTILTVVLTTSATAKEQNQIPVDGIAAVVGGQIILLSEVRTQAKPALQELDKAEEEGGNLLTGGRRAKIIKETLDQIIDEKLIIREAREMKLTVETAEVDRAIANVARENGLDLETFHNAIRAQGMDIPTYRSQIRKQLLRLKVLNLKVRGRVKIDDEEARQYYNDQVRDVRATGSFEGAHILVRLNPQARAVLAAEARKRAEKIKERIVAGEDFAKVAREVSEDKVTAPYGGSLGKLEPGTLPSVLDRAFLDLEPGELAGPIRSAAGFHILKLVNREALGVQPFAEVKDRIIGQLAQEEMVRQEKIWLKELKLRTFIDVRL